MARRKIRTRFLVISDTHGQEFPDDRKPLDRVDVAIHCGDLTETSKLYEFDSAIRLLKEIDAPLKLVIPGNHDFTLDTPTFKRAKIKTPPPDITVVEKEYGKFGEAERLMERYTHEGIVYLTEGVYHFDLDNGAHLAVYASPYTPSYDCWGFQFDPRIGDHERRINEQVDVIITHGPPEGILDITYRQEHIGCPELFEVVAREKPLMHCFGHAHHSWGAELIKWQDQESSSETTIDMEESVTIGVLDRQSARSWDKLMVAWQKENRKMSVAYARAVPTRHCARDELPIVRNDHTLFVNAAIQGSGGIPFNYPWVVDLDLPSS